MKEIILKQLTQEDFKENDKRKYPNLKFFKSKNEISKILKQKVKIIRKIGEGSFSDVYMGYMGEENKIPIAVKVLKDDEKNEKISITHDYVEEYLKFKILKDRKHLDCEKYFIKSFLWKNENNNLIITSFLGSDLQEFIVSNPKPSIKYRYKLIYSLLRGLKCLYCKKCKHGIINHCDLKLENLLITNFHYQKNKKKIYYTYPDINNKNVEIKIFDISSEFNLKKNKSRKDYQCITGTSTYISPERQFNNSNYEIIKDDVWAIGVLIIEILLWKMYPKFSYILSKNEILNYNMEWFSIIKEDIKGYDREGVIFDDYILLDLLNKIFIKDKSYDNFIAKKTNISSKNLEKIKKNDYRIDFDELFRHQWIKNLEKILNIKKSKLYRKKSMSKKSSSRKSSKRKSSKK